MVGWGEWLCESLLESSENIRKTDETADWIFNWVPSLSLLSAKSPILAINWTKQTWHRCLDWPIYSYLLPMKLDTPNQGWVLVDPFRSRPLTRVLTEGDLYTLFHLTRIRCLEMIHSSIEKNSLSILFSATWDLTVSLVIPPRSSERKVDDVV